MPRKAKPPSAKPIKKLAKQASSATQGSKSASGNPESKQAATCKRGVVLLSGGNPQIAKADGDASVQAYIAAMPGWKQDLGLQLDALFEQHVPLLKKGVKWNSPFYGVEGRGWIGSFHVFTHYVKVTFFQGALLKPLPPGGTARSGAARWIDIRQEDTIEDQLWATWIKQASALPGWKIK